MLDKGKRFIYFLFLACLAAIGLVALGLVIRQCWHLQLECIFPKAKKESICHERFDIAPEPDAEGLTANLQGWWARPASKPSCGTERP